MKNTEEIMKIISSFLYPASQRHSSPSSIPSKADQKLVDKESFPYF